MQPPDLIIANGDVVTMDLALPRAAALAVRDGLIVQVGSDEAIKAAAGPATRIVDAGGRLVLPGFQDTHIHLQDAGFVHSTTCDLTGARTVEQLVETLRAFAERTAGPWVRGFGWFSGIFHETNLDRAVLDRAVPDRPCFILSSDAHSGCVNTAACERLGLLRELPPVLLGRFVVDADGRPTGMGHEDASQWLRERLPAVSDEEYADGVRFAQKLCNRHGITGVLDALVTDRHCRVYRRLADAGELTVRIAATALVRPEEATSAALARVSALRETYSGGMLNVHSAKFFFDGVMESRTAAMIEPYADEAGGNAPLMFEPRQITELFTAFDAARFQIHVHAIGDLAVRAALDGFEAARRKNGAWPGLHQVAHVQFIDPADVSRFRALGAVANIQPLWARNEVSVSEVAAPMAGPERTKWMYAFRSLLDAGAPYALSSDWGVSTLNPFQIMLTAVTRQDARFLDTVEPFLPEQRLTRAECVKGYTVNAAAAAWRAETTGSLSPGKQADLIVLDRDVFACEVADLARTEVLLTLLGGREVHRSPHFDA